MNQDNKIKIQSRIQEIEKAMTEADFWHNSSKAQAMIKELQELKDEMEGIGRFDKSNAIMTIFSGAGGDDAEDFSAILYRMYRKLAENKGWGMELIHSNENDHGGYRNITIEITGKNIYGTLKNES